MRLRATARRHPERYSAKDLRAAKDAPPLSEILRRVRLRMTLLKFPRLALCIYASLLCAREGLAAATSQPSNYFGIRVIDGRTGRGVPLVELETTDHQRFVTDSGGYVAVLDPGLMDRRVFFHV